MQGVQSVEAVAGLLCGLAPLVLGIAAGLLWGEPPGSLRALARSPLFWCLLAGPVLGTAGGTWAFVRRAAAERRLRHQRNSLRDELDAMRQRERLSSAVVEAGQAAVVIFDPQGGVVHGNPAAERIFGHSSEAFARLSIDELLPDLHELDDAEALVRKTAAGDPIGREWRSRGRHADGTVFPVELEQVELADVRLRMVTVREATTVVKEEQRRVRDAVRAEHDRVVDLSRHRAELLDRLGRELRSHLRTVLSGCDLLATRLDATPDGLGDAAVSMRASAHTMLIMVDKLLNLSMADDTLQDLSIEPVAVPGLVDELVHSLQPLVLRNGNTLEVKVSEAVPILTTDRQKLAHALRNLLSNAARYTRNGRITLEAVLEPGRGTDWVAFFVSDTGTGLGNDELDQLFEAFSVPDAASTQEYLAVGTGLALSQHCARLLGGHIAARSAAGEGSTFTLRVPLRRAAPGTRIKSLREDRLDSA